MEAMCIHIINSNSPWYEAHHQYKDALQVRAWLEWFLKKWGFPAELAEQGEDGRLMGLRALLTEAMDVVIAGEGLSAGMIDDLNGYLASSSMHYVANAKGQAGGYELALAPLQADWDYVLCEIAASFVRLVSELDAARFSRCENPDCRSVFYDGSRNKMRKWCCNACSSLIKVRRHRQKTGVQHPK